MPMRFSCVFARANEGQSPGSMDRRLECSSSTAEDACVPLALARETAPLVASVNARGRYKFWCSMERFLYGCSCSFRERALDLNGVGIKRIWNARNDSLWTRHFLLRISFSTNCDCGFSRVEAMPLALVATATPL